MKYYRVTIVKTGCMNRVHSFSKWDEAKTYIDAAFKRNSSLIILVRPDDTVCLMMDRSMAMQDAGGIGPYAVHELRPLAVEAYVDQLYEGEIADPQLKLASLIA